jgi:hypothetical protein
VSDRKLLNPLVCVTKPNVYKRYSLCENRLRAHLFILRKESKRGKYRERGRRGEFKRKRDLVWGKDQEGD